MLSKEYIAGIFDGEGHVSITETKRRGTVDPKLTVKISNTHLPMLEGIQEIFGGSLHKQNKQYEFYLQVYVLSFSVEESKKFLYDMLPYLVIKKEQAEIALTFSKTVYRRGKGKVSEEEKEIRRYCMETLSNLKRVEYV